MKKFLTITVFALLALGSTLVFTGCHHHHGHHGPKRGHERRIKAPQRRYNKPAPKPAPKQARPAPKPHRR